MGADEPVRTEVDGGLVTIVLDQPPVNALDARVSAALLTAAAEVRRSADARAVIITGPAMAVRAAKAAIDQGRQVGLDSGLEIERSLFAGIFATEDREIGMRSFLEHGLGKAQFHGR